MDAAALWGQPLEHMVRFAHRSVTLTVSRVRCLRMVGIMYGYRVHVSPLRYAATTFEIARALSQVAPMSGPKDDLDESPRIVLVDKREKLAAFDTETDEQRAARVFCFVQLLSTQQLTWYAV